MYLIIRRNNLLGTLNVIGLTATREAATAIAAGMTLTEAPGSHVDYVSADADEAARAVLS